MKRSEILDNMALKLTQYDTWFTDRKSKEVMHLMLNELELLGMLPPKTYRRKDWNKKGITYSEWIQLPGEINEWEPEDEGK